MFMYICVDTYITYVRVCVCLCVYTGIACFSRVRLTSFCFYERPTLIPVFDNNSEEGFCFHEERQRVKIAFSVGSAAALIEAAHPERREWHSQAPFREPHLASQHPAAAALNCVCEHLCFISIYSVHLLSRCVLR